MPGCMCVCMHGCTNANMQTSALTHGSVILFYSPWVTGAPAGGRGGGGEGAHTLPTWPQPLQMDGWVGIFSSIWGQGGGGGGETTWTMHVFPLGGLRHRLSEDSARLPWLRWPHHIANKSAQPLEGRYKPIKSPMFPNTGGGLQKHAACNPPQDSKPTSHLLRRSNGLSVQPRPMGTAARAGRRIADLGRPPRPLGRPAPLALQASSPPSHWGYAPWRKRRGRKQGKRCEIGGKGWRTPVFWRRSPIEGPPPSPPHPPSLGGGGGGEGPGGHFSDTRATPCTRRCPPGEGGGTPHAREILRDHFLITKK